MRERLSYPVLFDRQSIVFRLVSEPDEEMLLGAFQVIFGRTLTRKWHSWFSQECPTGKCRYYIAVEKDTGELVGMYGLLPIKVKLLDQIVNGSLCVNVGVHPKYQGTGLFQELGRFALEDVRMLGSQLTVGVPNRKAFKGHLRIGWWHAANLYFASTSNYVETSKIASPIDAFPSEMDFMIPNFCKDKDLAVYKDHRFLNWRFFERPDVKYECYLSTAGSNIKGYVVMKLFHDTITNKKKAHIVDMHYIDRESFDNLIVNAFRFARGCDELNTWVFEDSHYHKELARYGFQLKESSPFIVYIHETMKPQCGRAENWFFSLGDNDVF